MKLADALRAFAQQVTDKLRIAVAGEPEEQLRAPLEQFFGELSRSEVCRGRLVLKGESSGAFGRADYAVTRDGLLEGHIELKAAGTGARTERYSGHNKDQAARFAALPNLLYTDGNEWALYRTGERVGIVRLDGDVRDDGAAAVADRNAAALGELLIDFLSWQPIVPKNAAELAGVLAPLCRLLRAEVTEALGDAASALQKLARDWRDMLFPDADDARFADAYAQTVTFALLLARAEGTPTLDLDDPIDALTHRHGLLSRALLVLTDRSARREIGQALEILQRVINEIDPQAFASAQSDPWLYFYEDFLAAYDPDLRRDWGVYYTPAEVVRAQVRLIDELLTTRLQRPLGFAEAGVTTLDPAVGTGTYLLGIIDHAAERVRHNEGAGAVPGRAGTLADNLHGFEWMVGPYAVAELRVSQALERHGAALPPEGPHLYLTNSLESPAAALPRLPTFFEPIAREHEAAQHLKDQVPLLVCLGNPPYDRHDATDDQGRPSRTGWWVRHGTDNEGTGALLEAILKPVRDAGLGGHLKNLYNLYVYFWRWALWKVFEQPAAAGPGIVSFITAASYLNGDAFLGLRERMRRECDHVWILDLGGEGRGTRQEENVFAIQTPVAIAVCARFGPPDRDRPAAVHYHRLRGNRADKLKALDAIGGFGDVAWETCPDGWHDPFEPAGTGDFFDWPLLTNLFPWQQSGVKAGRTWVIAANEQQLRRAWLTLLRAPSTARASLFDESRTGCQIHHQPRPLADAGERLQSIRDLPPDAPVPQLARYGFRALDRQCVLADARLLDRAGPTLWSSYSRQQVYLSALLKHRLGEGPALTVSADVPDLHHFRGSYGGKDILPLYRDAQGLEPNVTPKLLERLGEGYGERVTAEDLLAYVYALLAQPAYTERFWDELEKCEVRVPLTADAALFARGAALGRRLVWLHTYGERWAPEGEAVGAVPRGAARAVRPVSDRPEDYPETFEYSESTRTLRVGDGEFRPVAPEVWAFSVSGLQVVDSWLGYRMKDRRGRKSSPLDDIHPERWTPEFTSELLKLLWILEATLAQYPEQAALLEDLVAGPLLSAADLPQPTAAWRKPPKVERSAQQTMDLDTP